MSPRFSIVYPTRHRPEFIAQALRILETQRHDNFEVVVCDNYLDPAVLAQVQGAATGRDRVLVCLDSNHTHAHVLSELEAYAPLTSVGSYCVVFDTVIEDLPAGTYPDRPWGPGDNPKSAVSETHSSVGRPVSREKRTAGPIQK